MRILIFLLFLTTSATAQSFDTPQRGTQVRRDLLDAIRPIATWGLGSPIEFVVRDLRVSGDVAFAAVRAQRPGGGEIDMYQTPGVLREELAPDMGDGPTLQALYQKSGNMWVPVQYVISAGDAWWMWDAYCPIWGAVIPEACP